MISGHRDNHGAADAPARSDPPVRWEGSTLSPRQERAVLAMLSTPTIARAAEAVGVDESTLHRWLKDHEFVRALRGARASAFDQAVTLTHRYATSAVQVLLKVMADAGAPYTSRVAAAVALLRFAREGVLLDDLTQRVENLEAAAERRPTPGAYSTGAPADETADPALPQEKGEQEDLP
jgi:hypothetical protein